MIFVDADDDYLCGVGKWRPHWLHRWATAPMFAIILGLTGIVQGILSSYQIASITTLERRYAYDSTVTGVIFMADNIAGLIFNGLLGYLANSMHRPRLMAYCMLIAVFGCYLAATPYFIYGAIDLEHRTHNQGFNTTVMTLNGNNTYCDSNRNAVSDECEGKTSFDTGVKPVVVILWFSSFCFGFAAVGFWTIGIPFLDDSVAKKSSPLYLSAMGALRLAGPYMGFMFSSLLLRFHENPFRSYDVMDRNDPRWIGAWWLGFIILGTVLLILALILLTFPRRFKRKVVLKNHIQPLICGKQVITSPGVWQRISRLAKNPLYVCYILGTTLRLFATLGYMMFQSKYTESQYRRSASSANYFTGISGLLSMIGIFIGGLILRLQPSPRVLTSFTTVVEMIGMFGIISGLFLGCPVTEFFGKGSQMGYSMNAKCNDNCNCPLNSFQPLCDRDNNINYFSPCFAGCKTGTHSTNEYINCECFRGVGTDGLCDSDCGNNLEIFVSIHAISNLISIIAYTGNSILSFRIVEPIDKSFAIGIYGSFMNIFAFIPYPLVYGMIADAACLVWDTDSCGQRGNCWVYDKTLLKDYLHVFTLVLHIMASLFDIFIIVLSKHIKNLYNDDIEDDVRH